MLQSLVIDWMFLLILPVFFGTLMTRIMLTSEDQGYNHSVMRRKRMSDCRYDFLYALKTPTDCVFFVRMAEGVVLLGQAGNWNIWMSCSIGFVSREKFGF